MKKHALSLTLGIAIGAVAMAASPVYGAVKQYILTEVAYPIVVNGVAYSDPEQPILNYEGSTYVPLAKLGDLTGVDYSWNAQLQQVEINTGLQPPPLSSYEEDVIIDHDLNPPDGSADPNLSGPAGRENDYLRPDTEFVEEEEPGYKGYPDSSDVAYQWAVYYGYDLPPLLSEGWIRQGMLHEIEGIRLNGTGDSVGEFYLYTQSQGRETVLATFQLPEEFNAETYGETTVNGVRMIKHDGDLYFNIQDLVDAGIITE